jgi:hypothetical protein
MNGMVEYECEITARSSVPVSPRFGNEKILGEGDRKAQGRYKLQVAQLKQRLE